MVYELYEYELAEQIDELYEGLKRDQEEFVFAVTERDGQAAMVLVEKDGTVFVNEDAREKIKEHWPKTYESNLETLIPLMAKDLDNGLLAIMGVRVKNSE